MIRGSEGVRSFAIPAVDLPGRLDAAVVQSWAKRLIRDCASELAQRAGIEERRINCTAGILSAPNQWQRPLDAAWFDVNCGDVCGRVVIPTSLAVPLVAACLGYDTHSGGPLTPLDRQVLCVWLEPLIGWIQQAAGLPDEAAIAVSMSGPEDTTLLPAVMLSISLAVEGVQGTCHIVAPWAVLRGPVRREVNSKRQKTSVDLALLGRLPVSLTAVINGGVVALGDSLELEVGDILALDGGPPSSVEIRAGERAVAAGRLGSQGGNWAVLVSELQWQPDSPGGQEASDD